jgi:hypothetical protein
LLLLRGADSCGGFVVENTFQIPRISSEILRLPSVLGV